MDKETVLASARLLRNIPADAVGEYAAKREELVASMNGRISARKDILDLIGDEENRATMENNHANHAKFMESIGSIYDPSTFIEIILWVYRTYRSRGFKPQYWIVQLNLWLEILQKSLTEKSFNALRPFYDFILKNHDFFVKSTDAIQEDGK
jgi:hypothetical protein